MTTLTTQSLKGPVAAKSPLVPVIARLKKNHALAVVSLVWLIAVLVCAIAPQAVTSIDPNEQDIFRRCLPPSLRATDGVRNILGTDQLGRDVFSRIVWGSRISLLVGIAAAALSAMIGVPLGLLCGYYGGHIDQIIMRIADIQLAFPSMVLAIALVAILGPSTRNMILVLAIGGWVQHARVIRGQVMSLREKEYVRAAEGLGATDLEIMGRHLVPATLPTMLVISTFQVASAIVTEAALTFLGLGVSRVVPSWGGMLSDAQDYLMVSGWMATIPGCAIALTVLSINILGDSLRQAFDRRFREQ
jgi:peptide/nickel transport system permease protein